MKKSLLRYLGAAALALGLVGSAQATLLSDLLSGEESITVGDKLFDTWTLNYYDASDGRSFDTGNIDVTGIDDGGDYGLQFSVLNGELDVTGDDLYAYVDLMFGFRVSVTAPGWAITDNTLALTGSSLVYTADGYNDLGVFILEKVGTAASLSDLAEKTVTSNVLDDVVVQKLTEGAAFAAQNQIFVTKNILVWAGDATDSASLVSFEQRFSQTATAVPEPATLALLSLGLAGLGFARRRRS